jgi:hypothetical protein
MKKLTWIFTVICLFIPIFTGNGTAKAQQLVSTAGNHVKKGTVQLSWTIGETVIETFTGADNILTQGMHQSKLTVTAIEESIESGFNISALPNPASESVILRFDHMPDQQADWLGKDFYFQLYNLSGKLLIYKHVEDVETVILMDSFAPSTYFLIIIEDNKEIRTFKIIKK